MPEIESMTEHELRAIRPQRLDEDFLARLTACADASLFEASAEEIEFERSLRNISPTTIPSQLRASIEAAIGDAPFQVDEKIVLFNRSKERRNSSRQSTPSWASRFNLAAAAAVALLGSITALMLPGGNNPGDETAFGSRERAPLVDVNPQSNVAPVGFNRNLSSTKDEGVIWQGNNRPHRVLRLTYVDRFTITNEKGETVQVEQPRDEFIVVPEKVD